MRSIEKYCDSSFAVFNQLPPLPPPLKKKKKKKKKSDLAKL